MTEHIPAIRSISGIKVDAAPGPDGPGRVILSWIDGVNQQQLETFHGLSATQFALDLHAVTLIGEACRSAYLIGRIREVQRRKPLGE